MGDSVYTIIEKSLKGKTFRYRPTSDLYRFNSLDRNNPSDIWVENLSQNKPERFSLGQLIDLFELSKSELEQLSQSNQPISHSLGRGQKPKHQRGLKAGYSISNPVKGLPLTRYPIHPKH